MAKMLTLIAAGFLLYWGYGIYMLESLAGSVVTLMVFGQVYTRMNILRGRESRYKQLLEYTIRSNRQIVDCPFAWERIKMTYNLLEDKPLKKDRLERRKDL